MAISPQNQPQADPALKERIASARIGAIVPQTVQEVMDLATVLHKSRLFPDLADVAQAATKILAGSELGLPPFASLNSFHIVKGKVMMHYSAIAARVKAVGCNYKKIVDTDDCQTIEFYGRDGASLGTSSFSREDAKRVGTQNMDRMPRTMLFARAMSNGARQLVPEAFNGNIVYSNEERDEIEAEWVNEQETIQNHSAIEALSAKLTEKPTPAIEYNPFDDDAAPVQEVIETVVQEEKEQGELI